MASSTLIADYIGVGLHAARPSPPPITAPATAIYYETDTLNTFIWDGTSTWVQMNAAGFAFNAGVSTGGNTVGTTGTTDKAVVFAGINNITLSQATGTGGNTISISGPTIPAQTVQTYNILSASGNATGTLATFSTGTVVFAGGDNITLSQSSNTITINAANQGITLSAWEPYPNGNTAAITNGQNTIWFLPFVLPNNVTVSNINLLMSLNNTTNTNSGQVGFTQSVGIFSRVGTATQSISSIYSTAFTAAQSITSNASFAYSWNGSTSSSAGTSLRNFVTGRKLLAIPAATSFSAGEYWIALGQSTSLAGSANAFSISNQVNTSNPGTFDLPGQTGGIQFGGLQGMGSWSRTSAGMPNVVALTDINAASSRIYFNFMNVGPVQ